MQRGKAQLQDNKGKGWGGGLKREGGLLTFFSTKQGLIREWAYLKERA